MNGTYQIVSTFTDRKIKAELGEDIFQVHEDGDWFIAHEVFLRAGASLLILFPDDIDSAIVVLQKAKERLEERAVQFYRDDAASFPA